MKYINSLVAIMDWNHPCTACKFHALGFPCREYNEYSEEHAEPIKESRYALFERFVGIRGIIASTATRSTQALATN
jgi:hypothetical protein